MIYFWPSLFIFLRVRFPPSLPKLILIPKELSWNHFLHHSVPNYSTSCHYLLYTFGFIYHHPSCGVTLRHISHHFLELPSEIELQVPPPVVIYFITHDLSISPQPQILVCPGIAFPINHLLLNPYLRMCFWTQTKTLFRLISQCYWPLLKSHA